MPQATLPCITAVKSLRSKYVIVRSSLNVPIQGGVITSQFRVLRALPTLLHLTRAGARVVLITHIGRDPEINLDPLFSVLKNDLDIRYEKNLTGRLVELAVNALKDGQVLLLENVRSDEREIANDKEFARELASRGDIYVNDAFADSHREHASIVGIPEFLPSYIGLTFQDEFNELSKAMKPEIPSLFILGGAKFETKQPLIEQYLESYDRVFVGGALANDFFKAKGYEIGDSLSSDFDLSTSSLLTHPKILLPIDVVVLDGNKKLVVSPEEVTQGQKMLDVGPMTLEVLGGYIKDAKTILWNGPLGYYEGGYTGATKDCVSLVAKSEAHSIVGGGDTVAAIESLSANYKFDFLSTGGGAMLKFLEDKTLPGIEAIQAHTHE